MSWIATTFWKCPCEGEILIGETIEAVPLVLREIDLATHHWMLFA
jgi:hypothetical protein